MKQETKRNIKEGIETTLITLVCTVFVLSLNKSCSNLTNKTSETQKVTKSVEANKKAKAIYFHDVMNQKSR